MKEIVAVIKNKYYDKIFMTLITGIILIVSLPTHLSAQQIPNIKKNMGTEI